jgi:hypothetical protein
MRIAMRFAGFLGLGSFAIILGLNGCGDDSNAPSAHGGTQPNAAAGEAGKPGAGDGAGGNVAGQGGGGAGDASSAAGAAVGPCLLALDWQLVDNFEHAEGQPTNVVGVAADAGGNVYAVGLGRSMNDPVGLLRKSSDAGATWEDVPWERELPNDIATDERGNVFVTAGTSSPAVLKSDDHGESFTSLLDIPVTRGSIDDVCNTGFVATGPAGVVVAGASCDSSGWVVMKSVDSGESWDTSFAFQLHPGKSARMQDVGVDSFGRAYAVGYAMDDADSVHWMTVREGADENGVVSDDYQLKAGLVAQARGFGSPSSPIVVGFATDGTGAHGIVRRQVSIDGWETIDQFETRATDVEVVGGQLLVVGEVESFGRVSIRSRRSFDNGLTWNPLPDYSFVSGQSSFAGQIAADGTGNVYAAVAGRDADGVPHWLVRKLACQ